MKKIFFFIVWFVLVALAAAPAPARIKLVALPDRGATILRLDHPAYTLVEEERVLTLQQGLNEIDFSWKGVFIDSDSIRLAVLEPKDQIQLLNVSYPPNEGALVWQLGAPQATNARVRISYLLYSIDRLVTYRGVATQDEKTMDLQSYLVLRNFSGEDFKLATVRLDYGEAFERAIQNEETKQMLFFQKGGLPVEKTFKWDALDKPWDPEKVKSNVGIPVYYTLWNKEDGGLGRNAFWNGRARVYQKDGHGSTIFLGEDDVPFVPKGDKMEMYIGDSRDIVVTQVKTLDRQINVRRNNANAIVLYDNDEKIEADIENFKDQASVLIFTQHIPGQWIVEECTHEYTLKSCDTLEFRIDLKPKQKVKFEMHYVRRNVRP